MLGLMQDWPLLCHRVIDHAAANHAERAIITRSIEGPFHTTTYAASPRARAQGRAAPRPGRRQARRPGGDAGLEHLAPSRGLVRHHGDRRRLSHRQSAPVPGPDRLDHQPRRGPRDDGRPDLRPAPGKARGQAADRRALRGADRRRPHADRRRCGTPCPTRTGSARSTAISPGSPSTRIPPPACATPRARPAIPRASSTRTARTCCTR